MQKFEFIKNIETIAERLKSAEIVKFLQDGFNQPSIPYEFGKLIPTLFISKSQYDQIMLEPSLRRVLELISGNKIYNETIMSSLSIVLRTNEAKILVLNSHAINFFSFHKGLIDILSLAKKLLSNDIINNNNLQNLDSGILLFTVQIDSIGLETTKYIKIFTLLSELVNTIEKVFKFEETEAEIVMLDSGSDTNIGLKTKVETAKLLFEVFKEIWDFITSYNFTRHHQKNNSLIESLTIRKQIFQFAEDGIITNAEAQEYVHNIKTRTDSLIGLKVLPRELIIQNHHVDSSHILDEYKIHLLDMKKD